MGDTPLMGAEQGQLGGLVAHGNTSDIWEWTPGTVVKLLRPGIPEHWATVEAGITAQAYAAGLPVPNSDGVVWVEGRPGVVLERIEGPTMWSQMVQAPADVPVLIEQLVDIQEMLHATAAFEGLPDMVKRVDRKIGEATLLSLEERREAHISLAALPAGAALCHGDMHPANLMMRPQGVAIVDWFDATAGHPVADLARSSLLMRPQEPDEATREHLQGATIERLGEVHRAYLRVLASRGLIDVEEFAEWEAVLAVARMSESVPKAELARIWEDWRRSGSDVFARELDRCLTGAL